MLPNLSNPEAAAITGGIVKDYLRKHPGANSYGFAPQDGMPRDFSPETLRLSRGFVALGARPGVPGEASITEEWLMFVNRVAAEVHEEFPQAGRFHSFKGLALPCGAWSQPRLYPTERSG